MTNMIQIGTFTGAFGVHGEARLKSFCATPEDIATYGPLSDEAGKRTFVISALKPVKHGFSVRVEGVNTREEAARLAGTGLYVARARLPSLPDDEFYHADLVGLEVLDTGGAPIGRVERVENHGAGDYLEITGPGLKNPVLLPFTRAAVPTVDLAAGRLIADPPDGVLPA